MGIVSKIRSLYLESPQIHYMYHLQFFHYIQPRHFVVSTSTESIHKVEIQALILPQFNKNQYFLNLQIFFHSFAHFFLFSELYTTSSTLYPKFILHVLFISTLLNSRTFDLKER